MNLWIVVTIRKEFLEDCKKFQVYGTNDTYLGNFSRMQVGDSLIIQLRAKSNSRNYVYLGPYYIIDSPYNWASINQNRNPWFKVSSPNGPRWLRQYPWCVFLAPSNEYIDSPRILNEIKDPHDGLIKNDKALKILGDLTRVEYLPLNPHQAYRSNRGVWVRSRAEYMIDNWFAERGIVTYYERSIFLSKHLFLPDWFIPRLNIYIEYLGLVGKQEYDLRWEEKESIYKENKLRHITLIDSDLENLNISIPRKIPEITKIMDR